MNCSNRIIRLVVLMFLFLSSTLISSAQSFYGKSQSRPWVVSGGGGSAKYFGDLANPGKLFESTRWGLEAGLEYQFLRRFGAKANFSYFRLKADDITANDEGRVVRNLNFKSNNIELSAIATVYLFESGQRYYQRKPVNFNIFFGVGTIFYDPRTTIPAIYHDGTPIPDAGKSVSLRKYKTENTDYSLASIVFPIGLGTRIMATPYLNIAIDGGYRYTLTDYLDDVSTTYPGIASFNDNPLAAALSDRQHEIGLPERSKGDVRGNPDRNDGYFTVSIKVEYYLPAGLFGSGGGVRSIGGGAGSRQTPKAYNKRRGNNKRRR